MQLTDRAATLAQNGHPVDKIELLVLGGTWSSYPHVYQERDMGRFREIWAALGRPTRTSTRSEIWGDLGGDLGRYGRHLVDVELRSLPA